eukprot:TRINITY_DN22863_c0_g1_i1.p1 TRINITY_DN22863_c0_g1~~TRINITY_DN22863_c0_g1_i1.p1  ORF type:complete len:154 (-),score=59.21 TRINITY_DN22863_c0_g1_i1:298-759(-)
MIRRPPRSTLSSSSAASDVYKRQLSSIAVIFSKIDEDNDGLMSFPELLAAYYPYCSSREIDQFVSKYDKPVKKQVAEVRQLTEEQEEELEGVMRLFDQNADGELDPKEMAYYCANLGIGDETIAEWFKEYDTDQNGTLSLAEFKEFFRREWDS